MRLLPGGPELPPEVLRAQEENRLVFYCGAGVSISAGFSTFRGLVDEVYQLLKETKTELEQVAFDGDLYDRTLGLLEARVGSEPVRKAVADALGTPNRSAFPVHEAILRLSSDPFGEKVPRLVTTNFDDLFDQAGEALNVVVHRDAAPALPVPKLGVWRSLVYLHGALVPRERAQLVFTAADFGKAYLTEGWAARFVTELFQNFVVLFIGYSLEDPVLRYIIDALASERNSGRPKDQAYALVGIGDPVQATSKENEWRAKGVEPVLYLAPSNDHIRLEDTLTRWADLWNGGLRSRSHLVLDLAVSEPTALTAEERSQLDWALEDNSAFSVFCGLRERAPLSWLSVLTPQFRDDQERLRALGTWASSHLHDPRLVEHYCGALSLSATSPERSAWQALRASIASRLARDDHSLSPSERREWLLLLLCGDMARPDLPTRTAASLLESKLLSFAERLRLTLEPDYVPGLGTRRLSFRVLFSARPEATRIRRDFDALAPSERADLAFHLSGLVSQVMEYHRLSGAAQRGTDISTIYRPSIAPSGQNCDAHDWRLLIELLRRAAEDLDGIDSERSRALVSLWLVQESPLFDRLVLHIVGNSSNWTTAEKLELAK